MTMREGAGSVPNKGCREIRADLVTTRPILRKVLTVACLGYDISAHRSKRFLDNRSSTVLSTSWGRIMIMQATSLRSRGFSGLRHSRCLAVASWAQFTGNIRASSKTPAGRPSRTPSSCGQHRDRRSRRPRPPMLPGTYQFLSLAPGPTRSRPRPRASASTKPLSRCRPIRR